VVSGNGKPVGDDDLEEAQAVAQRFLTLVGEGDHRGVWDLFSENAQAYVLNRAVDRGMDFDLMSAIRQGAASDEQFDDYLQDLLEGLRRDLRGVDLARLKFQATPEPETAGMVRVVYLLEMDVAIGDQRPSIPAGSVLVAPQEGEWKVERLIPRPG
jgi:hypothetical protein